MVEASDDDSPAWVAANRVFEKDLAQRKKTFDQANKALAAKRSPKPGRIAWMTDRNVEPPEVRLLKRGNH
jgi:hypothetical protein